jgi:hypothetical protein
MTEKSGKNRLDVIIAVIGLLGTLLTVIGVIAAAYIGIIPALFPPSLPTSTPTATLTATDLPTSTFTVVPSPTVELPTPTATLTTIVVPTPLKPRFTALRDVDIRDGASTEANRIAVLSAGGSVDIIGVSEDDLWYQVLLLDGNRGWVVNTSSSGTVSGNTSTIPVIRFTLTPTNTATEAFTATTSSTNTLTPTYTLSPTNTSSPTLTVIVTESILATGIIVVVNPPTLTSASTQAYPCDGIIPFGTGGLLNQVHASPNEDAPRRPSIERGSDMTIMRSASDFGKLWYQIEYNNNKDTGWILSDFVQVSVNCPTK